MPHAGCGAVGFGVFYSAANWQVTIWILFAFYTRYLLSSGTKDTLEFSKYVHTPTGIPLLKSEFYFEIETQYLKRQFQVVLCGRQVRK